jgi:hypothetical protein
VETLQLRLGLCLPYTPLLSLKKDSSGTKGELTNWQFDWGGRL